MSPISSYRIYDIAKQLKISSGRIIEICRKLGFDVKSHSSSIDEAQKKKIISELKKSSSDDKKTAVSERKGPEKDLKTKKTDAAKSRAASKKTGKKSDNLIAEEKILKEKKDEETKAAEEEEEEEEFIELEEEKFIKKAGLKENEPDSFKNKHTWDEEKRINIRKVLDKELDKEEREGKLRTRIKHTPAKKVIKKDKDLKPQEEKASEDKTETVEKTLKRPEIKKIIELSEGTTIKQLSEKIGIASEEIIQALFNMGEIYTINQPVDRDIVEILANEFSFKYIIIDFDEKIDEVYQDLEKDLVPRPPIVTVMGHVDHGKTTLLDAIRQSNIVSGEAGGITQSIGAYQTEFNGRKITFIDTPGHEAFTTMRARGAKVTDIAVIVVAADDGIMPQTIEAIDHAKDAKVPIIVAVNKIDLANANPDKVRQGMTEYGLVPEEWGGDNIFVNISAKNKQNIEELLETILLVADMNDLKGNPSVEGSGIIIESKLDKNFGPVGTVLIRRGKIKIGDCFVTGNSYGRIRTLRNEKGELLDRSVLSQPVEVSGFSTVPQAGDKFFIVKSEKIAKEIISKREYQKGLLKTSETRKHITLEDLATLSKENEIKKLKIVLKATSNGSLEAVEKSLKDAELENIKIEIIHKAVGAITDSDILLAAASDTIVIGFGVVANSKARILAKEENVEVRTYNIIYKLIDEIKLAFKGLLEPVIEEKIKGSAEIREVFKVTKIGVIAGSYILDGEIERGNLVRIIRDGRIIYDGKIDSLHRFKDDVKKVNAGYECGIKIENYQDVSKGDILEIYEKTAVQQ